MAKMSKGSVPAAKRVTGRGPGAQGSTAHMAAMGGNMAQCPMNNEASMRPTSSVNIGRKPGD